MGLGKKILGFIKDWKFIFIIVLLLLYLNYVNELYNQEVKQPSKDWSRALTIEKLKPDNKKDIIKASNIFTIVNEKNKEIIYFWYHNDKLNYDIVDKNGEILSNNSVKLSDIKPEKLLAKLEDDLIQIYSIEDNDLNKDYNDSEKVKYDYDDLINYTLDIKNNKIISSKILSSDVKDFYLIDDTIIYVGYDFDNNSNYLAFKEKDSLKKINIPKIMSFEVVDYNEYYLLAVHESNKETLGLIKYISYNKDTKEIKSYNISKIPFISTGDIDIGVVKDRVNIVVPNYDKKYNRIITFIYDFNIDKPDIYNRNIIYTNGYPKIVKEERDILKFLAQDIVYKGSDNKTINIRLYTFKDGKIIDDRLLTKTDKISAKPKYFTLGDYKYLSFIDKSGRKKTLMLSSNNLEIVNKTSSLSINEIIILLFETLISLLAVSFMSIIPILAISAPVSILIILAAAFKVYWMENNPKKVFYFAVIIHIMTKIVYFKYLLNSKINMDMILPNILKTNYGLIGVIIMSTLISIYCTNNFVSKNKDRNHFFGRYAFFTVIDITMITLMVYPYLYSFLAFGYLTIN